MSSVVGYKVLIGGLEESGFSQPIGLILIRLCTFIVAYFMYKHRKLRSSNNPLPRTYYLNFSVVLFGTLYLFITSLEYKNLTIANVFFSGGILIFTNLLIVTMDEKIYSSLVSAQEQRLLILQNSAYEKQLSIMAESAELLRLTKHDMNNHLAVLDEMFKNQEWSKGREYIEILSGGVTETLVSNSSNYVLDSILNLKLENLYEKGIKVSSQVKVPMELTIPSREITIILGNLLDNAITASENSEDKFLSVEISYSLDNLIIFIKNSFNHSLNRSTNGFLTTKEDSAGHGLGLKSVAKIIEFYDGGLRFKDEDNVFMATVILPMPSNKL